MSFKPNTNTGLLWTKKKNHWLPNTTVWKCGEPSLFHILLSLSHYKLTFCVIRKNTHTSTFCTCLRALSCPSGPSSIRCHTPVVFFHLSLCQVRVAPQLGWQVAFCAVHINGDVLEDWLILSISALSNYCFVHSQVGRYQLSCNNCKCWLCVDWIWICIIYLLHKKLGVHAFGSLLWYTHRSMEQVTLLQCYNCYLMIYHGECNW